MSAVLKSMTENSCRQVGYSLVDEESLSERTVWVGLVTIFAISFFVALVAHAYIGFFSRFISDDYCTAGVLRTHGFFGAQKYWFMTWQGRFSFTLAVSLAHLLGPKFVPFLTGIGLALWLTAMVWALFQIGHIVLWPSPIMTSLFMAEVVIVSTLATTPAVYQSLYWETGMLTYVAPLIIMTLYVGFLCRMGADGHRQHSVLFLTLSAILTFIAGGFSETYAALQMGALFLAILACIINTVPMFSSKQTAKS